MHKSHKAPPRPPLEQDAERVAAAMRRLTEIGCAEDAALYERLGHWPNEFQPGAPTLVHAVINPISYGCVLVMRELVTHLGTLIGPDEAKAMAQSFVDEQRAIPAVRTSLEALEALSAQAQAESAAAAGPSPSSSVH